VIAEEIVNRYSGHDEIYNPAAERQIHYYSSATPIKDIKQSEELFDNYLAMGGRSSTYWKESVTELKAQCAGVDVGVVTEYDAWYNDHRPRSHDILKVSIDEN
jgi:hypothetical protein